MFRALTCPSSGGTTAELLSTGVVYSRLWQRGYQMLCLCSCSSWGWACQGLKHVEDSNVTYMLLLNCALKLVEKIILPNTSLNSHDEFINHVLARGWLAPGSIRIHNRTTSKVTYSWSLPIVVYWYNDIFVNCNWVVLMAFQIQVLIFTGDSGSNPERAVYR